jgi:predicted neuraminidase
MKTTIFSLILLIVFSVQHFPQNNNQNVESTVKDSLKLKRGFASFFDSYIEDQMKFDEFTRHSIFNNPMIYDSSSAWLAAKLYISNSAESDPIKNNFTANVLNPLKQQFAESQNLKELKAILGAVQLGAVGFLAYKHIKEYGFLKEKKKK